MENAQTLGLYTPRRTNGGGTTAQQNDETYANYYTAVNNTTASFGHVPRQGPGAEILLTDLSRRLVTSFLHSVHTKRTSGCRQPIRPLSNPDRDAPVVPHEGAGSQQALGGKRPLTARWQHHRSVLDRLNSRPCCTSR